MPALIIAATSLEISLLAKKIRYNTNAKIIITGIGAASTAYQTMKAIQLYKPTVMVQLGIAGCFDKIVELGSVFAVSADQYGDLGVVESGVRKNIFDLNLASPESKPYKNGWLKNPHKDLLKMANLPVIKSVTVNQITTSRQDIRYFKESGATLESMEGAAFHHVALMEKIPFLQLRSVSNYIGERDKSKWRLKEAIEQLNYSFLQTKILETIS